MAEKLNREDEILETLTGLAGAVGSGFDKANGRIEKLNQGVAELRGDMDQQLGGIRRQLDDMGGQLNRIEHSILEEHTRRIEALERKVGLAA